MGFIAKARKLARIVSQPALGRGLRLGVAASIEHEAIVRSTPIATLIDVGANVGQFSLLTRGLHRDARIIAFEPVRSCAETYLRLFEGDERVTLFECAAGAETAQADLHISRRVDSSSLLPITTVQTSSFAGTGEIATCKVGVHALDELIPVPQDLPKPIFVKIDVQGYELEALKGMRKLLSSAAYVYVELSFVEFYAGQPLAWQVVDWLSDAGFRLSGVNSVSMIPGSLPGQADFLFERRASNSASF